MTLAGRWRLIVTVSPDGRVVRVEEVLITMTTRLANDMVPETPTHPGELILEVLEERGMSQRELARQMKRPIPAVNEIVHGKKRVTADTALDLEEALGIAASIWVNLQARYDLVTAVNARKQRAAS